MIPESIALAEGERMIATIRRHWFSLAMEGVADVFVFVCIVSIVVGTDIFLISGESAIESNVLLPTGFFFIALFGLLLWMRFFASWSDHWLDAWIITDRRVIDIEQKGFFSREVASFPIHKIQDITYTVTGLIPTWLHFGDVRIQTASISDDFIMRQVPFPQDVKEHLLEVLNRKNTSKVD